MFRKAAFKVLSNLILIMFLSTGQVAAAQNNNIDEVAFSAKLTSSSILTQQSLVGSNSFTGSASLPDQITFTPIGSMNVDRTGATVTLLNNSKVLVAGGCASTCLASAELYDPTTG